MSDGPDDGWETVSDPKEAAAAISAGADKGPVTLTGPQLLSTLDPATASQVKAMAEGRMLLPNGLSMRSPQAQRLVGLTAQYDPTFDVANAPARVSARKAFTSGAQGKNITSFNTALGHLGTLAQRTEDLANGSFPLWNGIANAAETATGDPRVTNFNVAKQAVVDELERAFKGTGGNVHEIRQWEDTINSSRSPAQLRGAIGQAADLLNSRIGAMRDSYNAAMGTTEQPLPMLNQHASDALASFQSPDYLSKGYQAIAAHPGNSAPPPSAPGADGSGDGGTPPSGTPPIGGAGGPGAMVQADAPTGTLGGDSYSTDRDKAIASEAQALLRDPKSTRADFDALAKKYGSTPFGQDLDNALAFRDKFGVIASTAPGQSGHRETGVLADVANSAVGAAGIGAANAASFGALNKGIAGVDAVGARLTGDNRPLGDIYADNLSDTNAKLAASDAAHPIATVAGEAAGFLGADTALSAIPGVAKLAARIPGTLRPIVGDALYGGLTGLGSSDHLADVPRGVLGGALLGAGGGALGRGIIGGSEAAIGVKGIGGIGNIISPNAPAAIQRLTKAGVTLTPGQVLGAGGGFVGRAVKGIEDRVAGFPIVGDIINSTRRGGVEDFNRAAINDALEPIGATLPAGTAVGHGGVQEARQAVSDAYSAALAPLRAQADGQLSTDLQAVGRKVNGMAPDQQAAFSDILDNDVQPYWPKNGVFDGEKLQSIKQGLDREIARRGGPSASPQDQRLADRLGEVRDAVMSLAGRSDPANAAAFRSADQAHALLSRVENAAAKSKDGVFSPNQFRQAVTKRGYGTTTRNVATGNAPMQQLATDASTILPSTVPDSGTAGRAALGALGARLGGGAAIGGAAGGYEGGTTGALTGAVLGSALLSRPSAKAIQYTLAGSRGAKLNTLGALLRRNAALGGAIGTPALLTSTLTNHGN